MSSTITPKAALYSESGVHILVDDRSSNIKRILAPMPPELKDKYYPGIDTLSPAKMSKALGLYGGLGLFQYDNCKTRKDEDKTRKDASKSKKSKAITVLCDAPTMLEDPRSGYIVLSLALLASVDHLLPPGMIPKTPSVYCGNLLDVPPFLRTLLAAVNGPETVKGSSYTLKQPSCLEAKRATSFSPAISLSPLDYLGGTLKMYGKEYRFWLPLWSTTVCIAPNLPAAIQTCIEASPSVIPFYCNKDKSKDQWAISIPGNALFAADPDRLAELKKKTPLIHAIIGAFLRNTAQHPKAFRRAFPSVNELYSNVHLDRHIIGSPNAEGRVLVAAFCTFQCFLEYVTEKGWLSEDQRDNFLAAAQAAMFPSTQSDQPASGTQVVVGTWDSAEAFWPFLSGFLADNVAHIHTEGGRHPSTAVGAIRPLKGQENYLILPRFLVADAYRKHCASYGLFADWDDMELSRAIAKWFSGLKRESDNSGWQYNFYRKDDIPQGQKSAKISCLGFPIEGLPGDVRNALPDTTTQ